MLFIYLGKNIQFLYCILGIYKNGVNQYVSAHLQMSEWFSFCLLAYVSHIVPLCWFGISPEIWTLNSTIEVKKK